MNNFTFKTWAEYKQETQPNEGFNVSTDYSTPSTEVEKRNQLQSLHSQIKTFINNTIVAGINALTGRVEVNEGNITTLQSHEIESITADETMTIRKVGKNISMSVNVSGTGEVTKSYVDNQDTALSNRITANSNSITTIQNGLGTQVTYSLSGTTLSITVKE